MQCQGCVVFEVVELEEVVIFVEGFLCVCDVVEVLFGFVFCFVGVQFFVYQCVDFELQVGFDFGLEVGVCVGSFVY